MTNVPHGFFRGIKVVAIIQARMGSERLPGKMMMDLGGKPLLAHSIDRLKQCETLTHIVVATPDKELAQLAYDRGVWGYLDTGDPNNVLMRYIKAAGWSGAQLVVRVCGDSPFIDPGIVDRCVSEYLQSRVDLVTNVLRRSFPKGMDVEVVHHNTLKRIAHLTDDPLYLEHVTLFCYENPALFRIKNVSYEGKDYSQIRCVIDTQRDLDKMSILCSRLKETMDVVEIIEKYEELYG